MLASLGFLVGESGFTPLFEGKIDGIGINQFWQVPTGFWPVILLFIAVPETFRALRGWMEPTVPENYFQLRPGYTPGDLDFDPLGLKPEDPEALKEMQTKELQHGRLAMLAAAGMIVQELQTGATLSKRVRRRPGRACHGRAPPPSFPAPIADGPRAVDGRAPPPSFPAPIAD